MDDLIIKRFINQVTIKTRDDGRYEARPTIDGKQRKKGAIFKENRKDHLIDSPQVH